MTLPTLPAPIYRRWGSREVWAQTLPGKYFGEVLFEPKTILINYIQRLKKKKHNTSREVIGEVLF